MGTVSWANQLSDQNLYGSVTTVADPLFKDEKETSAVKIRNAWRSGLGTFQFA
mgnify:CR=1 FL=1